MRGEEEGPSGPSAAWLAGELKRSDEQTTAARREVDALRQLVRDLISEVAPDVLAMPRLVDRYPETDWRQRARRAAAGSPLVD